MPTLTVNQLSHWYTNKEDTLYQDVSLKFDAEKFYAITGESGTGKTTFLSFLGGLDIPKEGNVRFSGKKISDIGLTNYRRKNVSIIFQAFNLIEYMTAEENLMSALAITNSKHRGDRTYALKVLESVGIDSDTAKRNVKKLSGGQQQRVAIARALSVDAPIILADEPTGNLDEKNTKEITSIFVKTAHQEHKTVIVVTHDPLVASMADTVIQLHDRSFSRK